MESDAWSRFSAAASKRHQAALQSRYVDASRDPSLRSWRDLFLGFEELDGGEDDLRTEYPCPFCSEDFDFVGLCCHIDDEHPAEARNVVCPICAASVGVDLVGHLMTHHGNFFKIQRRRKYHKGSSASHTMLSLFRKDLREGNLHTLLGGSSHRVPPPAATDSFISSLIYTLALDESSKEGQAESLSEGNLTSNNSDENLVERVEPSLTDKDQKERARRSMFVQELVLSTIFDSTL
ncbi:protein DEHYDRATION-INDUCED 19 homolog 2-like [Zingiber officinale]|uniref:protein DEHYDRATION-INDUCED 19 homolog 2-like n=1 Tax=Zingiber officinale TaxID=94328 RepID=UPI001C4DC6EA|nr:protein DEHYDRATION-INDUCED 19 homolog 2-like [Zingiber officinale]